MHTDVVHWEGNNAQNTQKRGVKEKSICASAGASNHQHGALPPVSTINYAQDGNQKVSYTGSRTHCCLTLAVVLGTGGKEEKRRLRSAADKIIIKKSLIFSSNTNFRTNANKDEHVRHPRHMARLNTTLVGATQQNKSHRQLKRVRKKWKNLKKKIKKLKKIMIKKWKTSTSPPPTSRHHVTLARQYSRTHTQHTHTKLAQTSPNAPLLPTKRRRAGNEQEKKMGKINSNSKRYLALLGVNAFFWSATIWETLWCW